jgi:hypothetical protein
MGLSRTVPGGMGGAPIAPSPRLRYQETLGARLRPRIDMTLRPDPCCSLNARTAPSGAASLRVMSIMMSITKLPTPGTGRARQT